MGRDPKLFVYPRARWQAEMVIEEGSDELELTFLPSAFTSSSLSISSRILLPSFNMSSVSSFQFRPLGAVG